MAEAQSLTLCSTNGFNLGGILAHQLSGELPKFTHPNTELRAQGLRVTGCGLRVEGFSEKKLKSSTGKPSKNHSQRPSGTLQSQS